MKMISAKKFLTNKKINIIYGTFREIELKREEFYKEYIEEFKRLTREVKKLILIVKNLNLSDNNLLQKLITYLFIKWMEIKINKILIKKSVYEDLIFSITNSNELLKKNIKYTLDSKLSKLRNLLSKKDREKFKEIISKIE